MTCTLSLIIPFYNCEYFILDCLNSIKKELRPGCEVILVDDGSTDRSAQIIEQECAAQIKSGSLEIIKIQNSGPGEARNVGVRAARGEYIGFLDADDVLCTGYFEKILRTIIDHSPDIIQFHSLRFKSGDLEKAPKIPTHAEPAGTYRMEDVRLDIFRHGKWFSWVRVFSKQLLKRHPFPSSKTFYEDLRTLPYIFLNDVKICLLDECLVGYRDNPAGTTRNLSITHAQTVLQFLSDLASLPRTIALDILIVQVCRTLVSFKMRLHADLIDLNTIYRIIDHRVDRKAVYPHLMLPDKLFVMHPNIYALIESFRLKLSLESSAKRKRKIS